MTVKLQPVSTMQSCPARAGWPSANAKQAGTITAGWFAASDVEKAHTWMQQDKVNRIVEGVQLAPYEHKHVLWERVDKTKPIGWVCAIHSPSIQRWSQLDYYPEANQEGGMLWHSGFEIRVGLYPEDCVARENWPPGYGPRAGEQKLPK